MAAKYIFVTGGVVSSIGKGITVASVGRILKNRGMSVTVIKLDPYLNVDPGTMSPYQHGEVFVTQDGFETDMDLGHYERFIDIELTGDSNLTAGQVYLTLINKERRGDFLGGTIQTVPHVTNEIKSQISSEGRHFFPAPLISMRFPRIPLLINFHINSMCKLEPGSTRKMDRISRHMIMHFEHRACQPKSQVF